MAAFERWLIALRGNSNRYSAVVQRDGEWLVAWLEGIGGVNAQARTLEGLLAGLEVDLQDILEETRR